MKNTKPIIIGHIDHGKTCLTAAMINKLPVKYGLPIEERNPWAKSMYDEYDLIMQKKSKLNHNQRKYIVSCVESK